MQLNATSLFNFVQVRTVLLGSQIFLLETTKERLSGAVRLPKDVFVYNVDFTTTVQLTLFNCLTGDDDKRRLTLKRVGNAGQSRKRN